MASSKPRDDNWYVNIPFSDLHILMNQLESLGEIKAENAQLRREMNGMRNMFTELQVSFGDLRKELKGR